MDDCSTLSKEIEDFVVEFIAQRDWVSMVELQRDGREPVIRSGFFCSWCPLLESCSEGTKFIARRDDPDATDDF